MYSIYCTARHDVAKKYTELMTIVKRKRPPFPVAQWKVPILGPKYSPFSLSSVYNTHGVSGFSQP
jgi:hypothetical protein